MSTISELLQNLHEHDQKRRREIIEQAGTSKITDSENKIIFQEFKGEVEERVRIVLFLIEKNALSEKDDYYFAATLIISANSFENYVLAYKLMQRYRELGGINRWGFKDKYFINQDWNMTREQAEAEVEKRIGTHPSKIDREE